jgi:hypothetical protein
MEEQSNAVPLDLQAVVAEARGTDPPVVAVGDVRVDGGDAAEGEVGPFLDYNLGRQGLHPVENACAGAPHEPVEGLEVLVHGSILL